MKLAVKKKFMIIFLITLTIFSVITPVFGAINKSYVGGKNVQYDDIDTKIKDSVVIDALATFAYSIGSLVETHLGNAISGLTGSNSFPWADRVIFNAMPVLDVNIFNPSDASLFKTKIKEDGSGGNVTPLAKIVRNTYFTILTIAVAFLTIVIGVAAVKLAITSIASEKAKYKEALTKWMTSIVLLFLMHNLISFILWMNEQMVIVASTLLNKTLLEANLDIFNEALTIDNKKALENFLEANKSNIGLSDDEADYINQNSEIAYRLINNASYRESVLFDAFGDANHSFRNGWKEFWTANGKQSIYALKDDIEFIINGSAQYTGSVGMGTSGTYTGTVTIDDLEESITTGKSDSEILGTSGYLYFKAHIEEFLGGDNKHAGVEYYKKYVRAILNTYNYYKTGEKSSDTTETPDLMASLGLYFKESAYTVPTDDETGELTGWHRSKLTITGALLYAIFVFQSLMYFFSYMKRFFYIVVLVLMAPAIVILDFLRKAIT